MADSRHIPSKRFADSPKDIAPVAPMYQRPASEQLGYTIPPGIVIKTYPAKRAYTGSYTWARKGGMMGGNAGACRGVTSNNGLGVVPQAFIR